MLLQGQSLFFRVKDVQILLSVPAPPRKQEPGHPDSMAHDWWQSKKHVRKHRPPALLHLTEEGTRPSEGK